MIYKNSIMSMRYAKNAEDRHDTRSNMFSEFISKFNYKRARKRRLQKYKRKYQHLTVDYNTPIQSGVFQETPDRFIPESGVTSDLILRLTEMDQVERNDDEDNIRNGIKFANMKINQYDIQRQATMAFNDYLLKNNIDINNIRNIDSLRNLPVKQRLEILKKAMIM